MIALLLAAIRASMTPEARLGHSAGNGPSARSYDDGAAASGETAAFYSCDLCGEHGMETPAVADMRMPSGVWANVCDAHRYRVRGANQRAVEHAAAISLRLRSDLREVELPRPSRVPDYDRECRLARAARRAP